MDFILKILALGLVFGLIELEVSMGHSGTERWAVLITFPHIFLRVTSRGSSGDPVWSLPHPDYFLLVSFCWSVYIVNGPFTM